MAVTAHSVVKTMVAFGYRMQKIDVSEELKTGLETPQAHQKLPLEASSGEDTPRDRFWTNFGPHFGKDFEV